MPKIKLTCDANDVGQKLLEELIEFAAQKQVACKFETRKAVVSKIESGAASTEREAARQIAEETGEPLATIRTRNLRAKKKMDSKLKNESTLQTWTCTECGESHSMDVDKCSCTELPDFNDLSSDAIVFANIAISQLERISVNDPKRTEAIQLVQSWINKNRG